MNTQNEVNEPVHVRIKDKGYYILHLSVAFMDVVTSEAKKKSIEPYDLLCRFVSDNIERIIKDGRVLGERWLVEMESYCSE